MTSHPDPPLDQAALQQLADELLLRPPTAAQRHARGDFRDEADLTVTIEQALAAGKPCTILVPDSTQAGLARTIQQRLAPGSSGIVYRVDPHVASAVLEPPTRHHQPGQPPGPESRRNPRLQPPRPARNRVSTDD